MVGVPRSQGCTNCRRKKKGCDLARPACGQCTRLGYDCHYEDRRWMFVSSAASSNPALVVPSTADRRGPIYLPSSVAYLEQGLNNLRTLERTAIEAGAVATFWTSWRPQDAPRTVYIGGVRTTPYIPTLIDLADREPTVYTAVKAVAFAANGRLQGDVALLRTGTQMYTRALSELNRQLQDPVEAQSDAVLACCRLLSMYEQLRSDRNTAISSQGLDWHRHVNGICRIIDLRGPHKHVADHGHQLYSDVRSQAAISGITRRTATMAQRGDWRTIPWQTAPRTLYDELNDITLSVPELLQESDRIVVRLLAAVTEDERREVLLESLDLMQRCIRACETYRGWEQKAVIASMLTDDPELDPELQPKSLVDICKSHGHGFFHVVMQYWSSNLILHSMVWMIYRGIAERAQASPSSLPFDLPTIPSWIHPQPISANITANTAYYFTDEAGFWGATSAAYPLGCALHYLAVTNQLESPQMDQLREIFKTTKHGGLASQFLRSMANTPGTTKGDPESKQQHKTMASAWYKKDVWEGTSREGGG